MKLDRNINPDGCGKYALINLRKSSKETRCAIVSGVDTYNKTTIGVRLIPGSCETGRNGQFFVLKYTDKFASAALHAYADAAQSFGKELMKSDLPGAMDQAEEILEYASEIRKEAITAESGDKIPT